MKHILVLLCAITMLASCGGDDSEEGGRDIKTADVQGSITAPGSSGDHVSHTHNDEGEFECAIVKFDDDNRISICPTQKSLEDFATEIEDKPEFAGTVRTILERGDNFLFLDQNKKGFRDEKDVVGFNFIVIIENPGGGNYILEGEGDTPFDPILEADRAKELMEYAQSFKPS